ncbi:MAG: hypothetical protein ACLUD2_16230 [Clostridium sp.]
MGVGYGLFAGLILIFAGRPLSMIFRQQRCLGASGCLRQISALHGIFLLEPGHLKCNPYGDPGPWYSGRAFFSGVMEMIARTIVSLGFVETFGYTAICFADQTAWIAACC